MLDSFETVCRKLDRKPDHSARLYYWRGAKAGTFPAPVKLSPGRIAWRSEQIDAYLAGLKPCVYAKVQAGLGDAA